jgi:hypothetical protein
LNRVDVNPGLGKGVKRNIFEVIITNRPNHGNLATSFGCCNGLVGTFAARSNKEVVGQNRFTPGWQVGNQVDVVNDDGSKNGQHRECL